MKYEIDTDFIKIHGNPFTKQESANAKLGNEKVKAKEKIINKKTIYTNQF